MRLKTILACLTTPEHSGNIMKFAASLARRHAAHLVGLHAPEALDVYPSFALHVPDTMFLVFNENQDKQIEEIKAIFERHTHGETFPSEFRLLRADRMSTSARWIESAHTADLVIMAQDDKTADRYDQRGAQVEVIRNSGCPVIVVPAEHDGTEIGKNIVLGWSDTREAARAAHDMLSVAQSGADVTILRVGKASKDTLENSGGISVAEMLSRHDLKSTLAHRSATDSDIAGMLDQVAFEQGADLIVTGALGHSKVYDFVIGATTHALLKRARIPVMFSK